MKVTINNKIGKPAKDHLQKNKTKFPSFKITTDHAYNSVVVEIDDEDADDFMEALSAAGFDYESDSESEEEASNGAPRWPKFKPIMPKQAPKLPRR